MKRENTSPDQEPKQKKTIKGVVNGMFSEGSGLMNTLNGLADFMLVNLSFLFCCLVPLGLVVVMFAFSQPLIDSGFTFVIYILFFLAIAASVLIGAASPALFTAGAAWVKKESSGLSDFWRCFKRSFRGSIAPWFIAFFAGAFLAAALYTVIKNPEMPAAGLMVVFILMFAVLFLAMYVNLFPFYSRFNCTTYQLFTNALVSGLSHPLRTIVMMALTALPWVLLAGFPDLLLAAFPVWAFAYFSLRAYFSMLLLRAPYERYADLVNKRRREAEKSLPESDAPQEGKD